MKKHLGWIILSVTLVALGAVYVWASSPETATMTPRASEEWSRGQIVGRTPVKQPVALRLARDGGVLLVWPNMDGRLELAHIGADGKVLENRVLPVATTNARDPQLDVGPEGRLHLLWREQGGSQAGVRYALLEADGNPVAWPQHLSGTGSRVLAAPRLARDAQGQVHAFWVDDAGIHQAVLDQDGELTTEPALLVPGAHSLLVQVDDAGRLHLVWQQEERINVRGLYYARLDEKKGGLSAPAEITALLVNDRMQLDDLAFGLGQDRGYVLWSEYDEGFDRYMFKYTFFSLDDPQQKQAGLWHLKIGDGPTAIALPDGQHTPLMAALSERIIGLPGLESTGGDELAHYLIRNEGVVASGQDLGLQITLIDVESGPDGAREQVVTASPLASMKPVLVIDSRSHRHVAWLETGGFGQYKLVYASSAPEVLKEYNALTLWDVVNLIFTKMFRLSLIVVGVVLTFITWAILPLLGLVAYHLITSEETMDTGRSRVALVTVLAGVVALTFVLPPRVAGVQTGLPVLRWGIPAVVAVVTAAITTHVMRRRSEVHLFATFFLFTILNSLLQMGLYLLF